MTRSSVAQSPAVALTQQLLAFDTINPPGNERDCAEYLGTLLADGGFKVESYEFAPNRTSLIARLPVSGNRLPLCLTGHIDVVPLGATAWSVEPFAGEIDQGKLYGRGSSDMKSGIAAMVTAALHLARQSRHKAGLVLVITAGEEIHCQGAYHLASLEGVLGKAGAIVVGEPTCNYPYLGHRGVLWLKCFARGVTAHGSMPEQGINAIYKASQAINRLASFRFDASHPVLGKATLNVGTMGGGLNLNSVPDHAEFTVDVRTVPPQTGNSVSAAITKLLGDEISLEQLHAGDAVASAVYDEWVQQVFETMTKYLGKNPEPCGAPYFTDAAALTPAMGNPPTIIMGPGELTMAHKTDEFCYVHRITEAVEAYVEIAENWCI